MHFYGHAAAITEAAAIYLAEGGGGDRFSFQAAKQAVHIGSQVLFDAGPGQVTGEGGQLILEPGQFLEQRRWHDVWPGGKGLARLNEGRPQLRQQVGGFPGPGLGHLGIFEPAQEFVAQYPKQEQANRYQGLIQPSQ